MRNVIYASVVLLPFFVHTGLVQECPTRTTILAGNAVYDLDEVYEAARPHLEMSYTQFRTCVSKYNGGRIPSLSNGTLISVPIAVSKVLDKYGYLKITQDKQPASASRTSASVEASEEITRPKVTGDLKQTFLKDSPAGKTYGVEEDVVSDSLQKTAGTGALNSSGPKSSDEAHVPSGVWNWRIISDGTILIVLAIIIRVVLVHRRMFSWWQERKNRRDIILPTPPPDSDAVWKSYRESQSGAVPKSHQTIISTARPKSGNETPTS